MVRTSVTHTLLSDPVHAVIECKDQRKTYRLYEDYTNKQKRDSPITAYDKVLPKDDPKFLAPLRRWEKAAGFQTPLIWMNVILISAYHVLGILWTVWYLSSGIYPKWQTALFGFFVGQLAGFGVTGGAHRYWCHRSYKAKLPLQILLMICYSIAGQNNIYDWVRDHRVHHKFSETSADPHNANRGFFFSHVGWLMMKKHPDVYREGAKIDMSDITNDSLIKIHKKYFNVFKILLCFIIPSLVPLSWGERLDMAILSQAVLRYLCSLNFTWSVNSFAHLWGHKPYDKNIMPSENWGVSIVAMGEGWHNYHHTFPWDYKAAELAYTINFTTLFLDFFGIIGWAYDKKEASPSLIQTTIKNRGNGHLA